MYITPILYPFIFFPFSVSAKNLNVPYQYETIQDAVRFAAPNDTILVAPGTYQFLFENLKIINISLTLKSSAGPLETIISGKGTTPIITIDGISKVTIEGFTITSRKTAGDDYSIHGGGIFVGGGTSPTIRNNIITGNTATFGSGIYCDTRSSPRIISNLITENNAFVSGGGIFAHHSKATIIGNRLQGNVTGNSGGAIAVFFDSSHITNNVVFNNKATFGGGISCDRSATEIANNTIVSNQAEYGGGIFIDKGSVRMTNVILWENKSADLFLKQTSPTTRPANSDIQDGSFKGFNGNISVDPKFSNDKVGDFHLHSESPAINSGAEELFFQDPDGSRSDMGAYGGPDASQLINLEAMVKHE